MNISVFSTWIEFSRGIIVAAGLVTNKSQSPLIGLSFLVHLVKFIGCCAVAQYPPPLLSLPFSSSLLSEGKQTNTLSAMWVRALTCTNLGSVCF